MLEIDPSSFESTNGVKLTARARRGSGSDELIAFSKSSMVVWLAACAHRLDSVLAAEVAADISCWITAAAAEASEAEC